MPASSEGRDLIIRSSIDEVRAIRDVLVGDVWIMTGSRQLDGQLIRPEKDKPVELEPLSLVREFRIKTKARRFRTPRKLRMEIGGGKYVASWQPADFDDVGDPPSVVAYHFASQVQQPGVPVGVVTLGAENPPITWVSHEALQSAAGFDKERDDVNLRYPNTDVCKRAVVEYIAIVKQYNQKVASLLTAGEEIPVQLADAVPAFPEPYYNQWVSRTDLQLLYQPVDTVRCSRCDVDSGQGQHQRRCLEIRAVARGLRVKPRRNVRARTGRVLVRPTCRFPGGRHHRAESR